MIHDFITDLASDGLRSKDFTFNKVKSETVNIDKTDGKLQKVPEDLESHTSDGMGGIDSELHSGETKKQSSKPVKTPE